MESVTTWQLIGAVALLLSGVYVGMVMYYHKKDEQDYNFED